MRTVSTFNEERAFCAATAVAILVVEGRVLPSDGGGAPRNPRRGSHCHGLRRRERERR